MQIFYCDWKYLARPVFFHEISHRWTGMPVFPKTDTYRKVCLCFPGNAPRQKGMLHFPRKTQTERRACVSQERPRWRGMPVFSKKDPDRLDKGMPIFFEKPKRHAWIYPFFLSLLTRTATLAAAVSTVARQNPTKKSAIFVSWESDGIDAQFKYIYTHGLL